MHIEKVKTETVKEMGYTKDEASDYQRMARARKSFFFRRLKNRSGKRLKQGFTYLKAEEQKVRQI